MGQGQRPAEIVRTIACIATIGLGALVAPAVLAQQTAAVQDAGPSIEVRLSNFAYAPEHLRLKQGVPIRLRLVNESNGGHDFSAPAFFAGSRFPPGSPAPVDGAVAVGGHQTVEITVTPGAPGVYRVECTHFLHSIFGMHGTVEVAP